MSAVAFAAGFGSLRRFNGEMRRTFSRTPTELRRRPRKSAADPDCYRFKIAYRPPYDWPAMLAFLSARATPGVECVCGERYERTITVNGKPGSIAIVPEPDSAALVLEVRTSDTRSLLAIVERVRRMFDIGADPAVDDRAAVE